MELRGRGTELTFIIDGTSGAAARLRALRGAAADRRSSPVEPRSRSERAPARAAVGVIGAGAMGMGVVRSLLRGGFATHVRDIRPEAEAEAAATARPATRRRPRWRARATIVVLLVVDTTQIETVLFGPDGAAAALAPGSLVLSGSTVAPDDVAGVAPRRGARRRRAHRCAGVRADRSAPPTAR